VRNYPADVIVGYLTSGVLLESVRRTVRGADFVVERLASRASEVRCGVAIEGVATVGGGVELTASDGSREFYDHAIVATQANDALEMLTSPAREEEEGLESFGYESSTVIVHGDPALAPRARRNWAPVNFLIEDGADRPMATIWLNPVVPDGHGCEPIFQTWNPLVAPEPARVRAEVSFQRPLVDERSTRGLDLIATLHAQPGRRLWFCGSYAQSGVPLLESAVSSALAVRDGIAKA
jgi:predicted NAD/FAD-binding protein